MAYRCNCCGDNEKSIRLISQEYSARRMLHRTIKWFCYLCNRVTEHVPTEEPDGFELLRTGIRPVKAA